MSITLPWHHQPRLLQSTGWPDYGPAGGIHPDARQAGRYSLAAISAQRYSNQFGSLPLGRQTVSPPWGRFAALSVPPAPWARWFGRPLRRHELALDDHLPPTSRHFHVLVFLVSHGRRPLQKEHLLNDNPEGLGRQG